MSVIKYGNGRLHCSDKVGLESIKNTNDITDMRPFADASILIIMKNIYAKHEYGMLLGST